MQCINAQCVSKCDSIGVNPDKPQASSAFGKNAISIAFFGLNPNSSLEVKCVNGEFVSQRLCIQVKAEFLKFLLSNNCQHTPDVDQACNKSYNHTE
jgi:hypothetical protein